MCAFLAGAVLAATRGGGAAEIGPDTFGYRATDAIPFAFEDIAATGTVTLEQADDFVFVAPIGFVFRFYGRDHESVSWSPNGLMTFISTNSQFGNVNIATTRTIGDRPSIAVLWDDWTFEDARSQGVYYETRGVPGARRFIVQWTNAVGVDTLVDTVTFQAVLHEGTNDIVLRYLDVDSGDARSFGAQATVGIRDTAGHTNGRNLQWSFNSAVIRNGQAIRFSTAVDGTPPMVDILSPDDGAVVATTELEVLVSVADDSPTQIESTPFGLDASLPAGGGNAGGEVNLVEGPNAITVTATDASGNTGGAAITVTLDTIRPRVPRLFPASGAVFGESPAPLSMDVDDATPTTVVFAGNSFSLPAGGGTVEADVPIVEGSNTIEIVVTDAAGNQALLIVDVILDSSAPLVTIDSPAGGACLGAGQSPVPVVVTVDDVAGTSIASEPAGVSGSLPPGGGILTGAVPLVEGPNAITVTATDATGRMSSASIVVVLDTMLPSLSFTSPLPGEAVRSMIDVAASVSEGGCGLALVDLRVDGEVLASMASGPFEAILDTETLEDGVHVLSAAAADVAGNTSSVSMDVLVDNTPPAIAMTAPEAGVEVSGLVGFAAQASDSAGAGLVFLDVLVNGVTPSTAAAMEFDPPSEEGMVSGEEDTNRWPDGPLSFAAMAVDAAGNQATAMVTVMVKNTVSATISITPAGGTVSGIVPVVVDVSGAPVERIEVLANGLPAGSGAASPFSMDLDTTKILDGPLVIAAHVLHPGGQTSSASVEVTVDNLSVLLVPAILGLDSRGCGLVVACVGGPSAGLLLPVEEHAVELRVPGGSPVPADSWRGDDRVLGSKLFLRFDRRRLASSVKAGIGAGMIEPDSLVEVTLMADGSALGTAYLRIHARERD